MSSTPSPAVLVSNGNGKGGKYVLGGLGGIAIFVAGWLISFGDLRAQVRQNTQDIQATRSSLDMRASSTTASEAGRLLQEEINVLTARVTDLEAQVRLLKR